MKFLNVDINKKLPKKLLFKHISFLLFWIVGIAIFVFRLDSIIYSFIKINGVEFSFVAPVIYIVLLFFFFKNQKWYFTLAFFCYPLLLFFWFIPKWILFTGKIYIFLYYLNFILKIIKNFKKAVFVVAVALVLTILLVFGDSTIVKWFAVFFFSYVYYLFIKNFLREIFRPSKFSEKSFKTKIEEFALDDPSNVPFIRDLENQKQDDKLSPQEKESRIKERLININYLFAYLTQTLNGFRNERSYIFFCLFQLLLYFSISVLYFAFLNFQVFQINNNLFAFFSIPSFFDFIYYTLKTITFSNIDILKPNSSITRIIEILSFIMLGVFLLIIVVSLLFSLQRYKLKDMLQKSAKTLETQNKILSLHIEKKYGNQINNDENGFQEWIKKILNQIF